MNLFMAHLDSDEIVLLPDNTPADCITIGYVYLIHEKRAFFSGVCVTVMKEEILLWWSLPEKKNLLFLSGFVLTLLVAYYNLKINHDNIHILNKSTYKHPSRPSWERIPQFLDSIKAFSIHDKDPLAMTFGITPKKGQGVTTESSVSKTYRKPQKRIFVANHPGWNWLRMGNIGLELCPVTCELTIDPSEQSIADAIIFYGVGFYGGLPARPPGQIWIFFSLESPIYSLSHNFRNSVWRNQINWTMTYRIDSDIWYPYGRVNKRETILDTDYSAIAANKTKMIAWFVSHCRTDSKREDYVREIQKKIPVDVFGSCGNHQCGPEGTYECLDMLTKDYKFYISFENALCDDYVTEKVFRKLIVSATVPLVRGHVNYTRYLPPKSFINVDEFDSVSSLTNYLNYLNNNLTAYVEYLEWRRYYFVVEKPNPTCEVCMKLAESNKYRKNYEDIYSWWTKDICHQAKPIVTVSA